MTHNLSNVSPAYCLLVLFILS